MKYSLNKYFFLFVLTSFFPFVGIAQIKTPEPQNTIRFTENKNQWDKQVMYRAQLDGGVLFLQKNCFTYSFYDKETLREQHLPKQRDISKAKCPSQQQNIPQQKSAPMPEKQEGIRSHAFRMTFLNAESSVTTSAKQVTPDYCNFFIGNDKNKWVGNAKNYKEVNYKDLYKGIDLQVLGFQNSLKYNFIVAPTAEVNKIKLFYEGLDKIVLEKGALKLTTSLNEMVEQRPYAYQWIGHKRVDVPCEFVLENTTVSFNLPYGYDKSYELVIDPVLIFAASSGSLADNFGMTATYDARGHLYSGGTCFDQGYPTTLGAYDTTYSGIVQYGRTDVVITKYDSTGTTLHYSTYLGGAVGSEIVTSLVINAQNELLLYGATGSSDFPHTSDAFDTTFNGGIQLTFTQNGTYFFNGTDIYVAKLNSTGSSLLASTFIGGNNNDGVNTNNIVDLVPKINISGLLYASQFDPAVVSNAVSFIPERNVSGTIYGFVESRYDSLQYNYGDQYRGEINVDKFGNIYIASSSRSTNFPKANGFDTTLGGMQDAVVFKLNSNLSQLIWSTYLGGSDNDAGYALSLDDSANVYVTGGTRSLNFPTTLGALRTTYNGGKADGYITKIKKDGTAILFSTFWGTNAYDQSYFVQLDKNSNVYVVGQTEGAMPVTAGVYNNPNSGQFITKMNDSLNTLIFSTVFGNGNGKPNISPSAFLVDSCENIYVSGWGGDINTGVRTDNMPLTANAYQSSNPDGFNFYLFVLSNNASSLSYATYFGGAQSEEHVDGGTSRFDKKGVVYQSVCAGCWGNDDFPVSPGAWPNTGADVNHSNLCNNGVFKFDFHVDSVYAKYSVDKIKGCQPFTVNFNNQSSTDAFYLWNFGDNDSSLLFNPIKIFTDTGTFSVQLRVYDPLNCNHVFDTISQLITVLPSITTNFDFIKQPCSNQVLFSDSSAVAPVSWLWDFGDGDSSTIKDPTHIYNTPDVYDVLLISSNVYGCKDTADVLLDLTPPPVSINNDTSLCKEKTIQLNATGGINYSWAPSINLNDPSISNPLANPITTTTYTVNITTIGALGDTCSSSLSTTIDVVDPSLYSISATTDDDTLLQGQSTKIHAITDSTLTVTWLASSGVSLPNSFHPVVTPESTTTYTVTIFESIGCPKSSIVTVYVVAGECDPADVYVPNTFTPNGDGKNDVLFVRGNAITELYFAVYNRWGQMVFETTDLSIGWNGIYKNMQADPVVFAWYVRAKCFNGDELKKQGNVTLIR